MLDANIRTFDLFNLFNLLTGTNVKNKLNNAKYVLISIEKSSLSDCYKSEELI